MTLRGAVIAAALIAALHATAWLATLPEAAGTGRAAPWW